MDGWVGSVVQPTIAGAWSKPQCIGTRLLLAGGFTPGLCPTSGPRQNWVQRAQPDDHARDTGHRPDPLMRAERGETQPAVESCTKAVVMRSQPAHRLDVELLRPRSQPGQDHVLDHPRALWRHGGPLSLMSGRLPRARTLKDLPARLLPRPRQLYASLGEAVPSNSVLQYKSPPPFGRQYPCQTRSPR